ncbi:threonine aldolase family protein [Ruania halotolerans]|uniref:threonine aldolase family protein n=1 Tax=Ruania halotolerans TaxID=2897773 RepID=UPI001E3BAC6B|nr:beta-eliminating lyase-related protein [Ruania halotolerans]UFU05918.1 beta-eliminating lyase-related protein [Ruania halotolerans]
MSQFASDNYAAMHPEVLAALAAVPAEPAGAYGADPTTAALASAVRRTFGEQAEVFPVLTGTGANVVSLTAMLPRWGAVIATDRAHLHTDENGAPERVGGIKVLPVPAPDAKLTPEAVHGWAGDLGDIHRAQPLAVSLTQATELGTVYTPGQVRAVAEAAHAAGMAVHLDGARLANAAASLGCSLREITTDVGVDVLSFGGTKNGAALAESVIVLNPEAVDGMEFVRKSAMQLASKQRYVSAQLLALLTAPEGFTEPLWWRNARHANAMAARLREAVLGTAAVDRGLVQFTQPTEANVVFARVPRQLAEQLRHQHHFYDWAPGGHPDLVEVRWMCSWDTRPEDVDQLAAGVGALA